MKIAGAAAAVAVVGMRPRVRFGSPREEGSRRERSVSILEDQKGKEKKRRRKLKTFFTKNIGGKIQDPKDAGVMCRPDCQRRGGIPWWMVVGPSGPEDSATR